MNSGSNNRIGMRLKLSALWSLFSVVLSKGFSFFGLVVVAWIVSKEEYGKIGALQSTIGALATFGGMGLTVAAAHFVSKTNAESGGLGVLSQKLLNLALIGAGVSCTVLLLSSPWLASETLNDPELKWGLWAALPWLTGSLLNGMQIGVLTGLEKFKTVAMINGLSGVSTFLGIAFGAWLYGVNGAVLGIGLGFLVAVGVGYFEIRKFAPSHSNELLDVGFSYISIIRYGVPVMLTNALVGPAMWLINMRVIAMESGYYELAAFNAANNYRLAWQLGVAGVFGGVFPIMTRLYSEGDFDLFRQTAKKMTMYTFLLSMLFCSLASMFSDFGMRLFGEEYVADSVVLVWMGFCLLVQSVNGMLIQIINATGNAKGSAVAAFVYSAVSVGYIFLMPGGAVRMVQAQMIGSFFALIILIYAYLRISKNVTPRADAK